jgi:hypothetical protein
MSKFRKMPVIIEAVQLLWENWSEMCEHAGVGSLEDGKPQGKLLEGNRMGMSIPTLEGVMEAQHGDWIIKGIQGEIYPCKPDIFEATYEAVD